MTVYVLRDKPKKEFAPKKAKDGTPHVPRKINCRADIPLYFLKNISAGSLRKLSSLGIATIEDLFNAEKDTIKCRVKNRILRCEILTLHERIVKHAKIQKFIRFEEYARNKNIRIQPDQREILIVVSIFSNLLKNLDEVLVYALNVHDRGMPYRAQAVVRQLYHISKRAILKRA